MRKIIAIFVALMVLPFTAFGLEMLGDDVLSDVTGQAGVSIAVDDVKLFQRIESLMYQDTDGLTDPLKLGLPTTKGAGIGITELEMMVNINAVTSIDYIAAQESDPGAVKITVGGQEKWVLGDADKNPIKVPFSPGRAVLGNYKDLRKVDGSQYNWNNDDSGQFFLPRAITIDVTEQLPILSEALKNKVATLTAIAANPALPDNHPMKNWSYTGSTNVAGVQIGLPTVEVHQTSLEFDISVSANDAINGSKGSTSASVADNSFGKITIGNQTLLVLDGVIEIAPH